MRQAFAVIGVTMASLLAACSQQSGVTAPLVSVASYQTRPELQDPASQAILRQYPENPDLLAALQTAYGERRADQVQPEAPLLHGLGLEEDRLSYIKSVAWNSVSNYDGQYTLYARTNLPYSDVNWERNGCSAPDGLGLGYREDFYPACNVHDFGYHNLGRWEATDENRRATDQNFHSNMDAICADKRWYKRPACYAASFAYYEAVRVGGGPVFTP